MIDLGYTTETEITTALHRQLNIDYIKLSDRLIDDDIIKLVGEEILRKHLVMPFEFKKGIRISLGWRWPILWISWQLTILRL